MNDTANWCQLTRNLSDLPVMQYIKILECYILIISYAQLL